MLLKAQIDRRETVVVVRHAVYGKPAGKLVAPASVAADVESSQGKVAEGITGEIAVVTGLQPAQGVRNGEIHVPPGWRCVNREFKKTTGSRKTTGRISNELGSLRERVGFAASDVIPVVALQINVTPRK